MKKRLSFIASLLALAGSAGAADLLSGGSFEQPLVHERTPQEKGGDPKGARDRQWIAFDHKLGDQGGKLFAGLSNEKARTGSQSLYLEFEHLSQPYQGATLQSRVFPVAPGAPYRISIWALLDAKNPLKAEGRIPFVKLQIDFYNQDGTEPAGESVYAVQPIPGTKNRPALFNSEKWAEFFAEATSPADAGFAQITWRWETSAAEGEANGAVFFDDAKFEGPPAPNPNAKPAEASTDAAAEAAAGEMTGEDTPAPSPSPALSPAASATPQSSTSPKK